jgi:hypothetical protein
MTAFSLTVRWPGLLSSNDRAVSQEAQRLRNIPEQYVASCSSVSVEEPYRRVATAVIEAAQEASQPNWDGQGGLPTTQGAVAQAFAFLDVLPTTLTEPDVSVDPDGELSFGWSLGPRRAVTASINADGKISFAALIGASRLHGTYYLLDTLPEPLTLALQQLHARQP